jgi:hypothetical protein
VIGRELPYDQVYYHFLSTLHPNRWERLMSNDYGDVIGATWIDSNLFDQALIDATMRLMGQGFVEITDSNSQVGSGRRVIKGLWMISVDHLQVIEKEVETYGRMLEHKRTVSMWGYRQSLLYQRQLLMSRCECLWETGELGERQVSKTCNRCSELIGTKIAIGTALKEAET